MYSFGSSEPKASSSRNGSRQRCRSWVRTRVSRTPAPSDVACPVTWRSISRERRSMDAGWVIGRVLPPRMKVVDSARAIAVAVAEVHEEVRLEPAVGKELPVDLLVVEPGHGTGVETDGASGKDEIGALQGAVPERRRLDQRLVPHEPRPGVDMREEPRELVVEPEVVGDDRVHGRRQRLVDVLRRQRRSEPLLRRAAPEEEDACRARVGARRAPLHEIVDPSQLVVRHLPLEPRRVGARRAEELVQRRGIELGSNVLSHDPHRTAVARLALDTYRRKDCCWYVLNRP